jgi:ribosomal protein S18 acetylase RimI-like enzyme
MPRKPGGAGVSVHSSVILVGMEIEVITMASDELVAAFTRLMPQLNPAHPAPGRADLQAVVESPGSTILVARSVGGEIIGTLTLVVFRTPAGVHAWIEDVVVEGAQRGQGVGEALTRAGVALAGQQGAHAVELTSRPAREAANRLYRRLGFRLRETNLYRLEISEIC